MKDSARQFHCARCHKPVVICRVCDRGNLYCGPACSRFMRTIYQRAANSAYQKTFQGRQKHAQRQQRYRWRQKADQQKVTYQGSPVVVLDDLLRAVPGRSSSPSGEFLLCACCGRAVSVLVRSRFLRYYDAVRSHDSSSWPFGP